MIFFLDGHQSDIFKLVSMLSKNLVSFSLIARIISFRILFISFLGKILQNLARHKLLTSTKGPNGGFGIERDIHSITLYEIIIIVDGDTLFDTCLIGLRPCKKNLEDNLNPCPVHEKFSALRASMREYFTSETVGSIISRMNNSTDFIEL